MWQPLKGCHSGQTLNVFTLGGLALGIGRLVDDSIVELENIQRHLNKERNRWTAIVNAAREVAMPIFASTVTTVVMFLPIFFVVGIAHLLLIPLTVTIAIALFTSFFVSRTVTPALCYKFLKPEQEAHRSMPDWFVRMMEWSRLRYEALDQGYEQSPEWILSHRRVLVVGSS
jgi:multidrug efflux pump subunit AcrB